MPNYKNIFNAYNLGKLGYYSFYMIPFVDSIFVGFDVGEKYAMYQDAKKILVKSKKENLRNIFRKNVIMPTIVLASRVALTGSYSLFNPDVAYADLSGLSIGLFGSIVDLRARERNKHELLKDLLESSQQPSQ
jgi:hypothetical protein